MRGLRSVGSRADRPDIGTPGRELDPVGGLRAVADQPPVGRRAEDRRVGRTVPVEVPHHRDIPEGIDAPVHVIGCAGAQVPDPHSMDPAIEFSMGEEKTALSEPVELLRAVESENAYRLVNQYLSDSSALEFLPLRIDLGAGRFWHLWRKTKKFLQKRLAPFEEQPVAASSKQTATSRLTDQGTSSRKNPLFRVVFRFLWIFRAALTGFSAVSNSLAIGTRFLQPFSIDFRPMLAVTATTDFPIFFENSLSRNASIPP